MVAPSTVFSYRAKNSDSSVFLKLEDVEKESSFDKVFAIYEGFTSNLFAYEKGHLETVKKIESRLRQATVKLNTTSPLWKKIVLSIFTLGFYWIDVRMNDMKIKKLATDFAYQIKKRESEEAPPVSIPIQDVIRRLKEKQLEGVNQELERLEADPFIKERLDFASSTYKEKISGAQLAVYGHTLELQKELASTHFVFNHGLNYQVVCLVALATALTQRFSSTHGADSFVLRHESFFKNYDKQLHTVQWFKNIIGHGVDDRNFRDQLICGDVDFKNTKQYSSALDFFLLRTNIAIGEKGGSFIKSLIEKLLKDFLPSDDEKVAKITNDIYELFSHQEFEQTGFGLVSMCIPKHRFHEVAYIARPRGYVYPITYSLDAISDIQEGRPYPAMVDDFLSWNDEIKLLPQVRVLAHKLDILQGDFIAFHSVHQSIEHDLIRDIDHILSKHFLNIS
jgi:hypothetical protein